MGYCAVKDEKYFGFKGHLLITAEGVTKKISVTSANIDEQDILSEVINGLQEDIIIDKGLIRPAFIELLAYQGLTLHTPLRKNMKDKRPKSFVTRIMDIRRKVETVIGQLVERFKIQSIKAKDSWHLMSKIGRKYSLIQSVFTSTISLILPLLYNWRTSCFNSLIICTQLS